jgi:hypothetical protein
MWASAGPDPHSPLGNVAVVETELNERGHTVSPRSRKLGAVLVTVKARRSAMAFGDPWRPLRAAPVGKSGRDEEMKRRPARKPAACAGRAESAPALLASAAWFNSEAKLQPHRVPDDVRRELVASKRDRCHSPSLDADPTNRKVPVSIPCDGVHRRLSSHAEVALRYSLMAG